jgi:hypothetical protein
LGEVTSLDIVRKLAFNDVKDSEVGDEIGGPRNSPTDDGL